MGRLVAPRNPAALADGIVALLRDPAQYQPVPERVRAIFSTQRSLDQYEALMERLRAAEDGNRELQGERDAAGVAPAGRRAKAKRAKSPKPPLVTAGITGPTAANSSWRWWSPRKAFRSLTRSLKAIAPT